MCTVERVEPVRLLVAPRVQPGERGCCHERSTWRHQSGGQMHRPHGWRWAGAGRLGQSDPEAGD